VAFLFDTDAISEVLRGQPRPEYIQWLRTVPREDQFTSAAVAAELYRGALRSERARFHLENIEKRVLPGVTVLPFDVAVARVYGEIEAGLKSGHSLADADLQIAATAIRHGLELVTGNVRHFETVPGLVLCRILGEPQPAEAQSAEAQPAETVPRDIHAAMAASEMYRWQPEED
jgi:predicted nucleic acid-binding protein